MELKMEEYPRLNEVIYSYVVDPGLQVYLLPKKDYRKKYAVFSTAFGSIDSHFLVEGEKSEEEFRVPDGVAHFLEHKLFEEEDGNIFDRFAALGAMTNAFTSFTQTAYLFSCTDFFSENLELLLNFVQNPYFTEESVVKEQGIIEQEIRMYQDNPEWRLFFNLLGAMYKEHPVKVDIAGTVESIRKITPDILYKCYRTFYHPANMGVFVVGDINPEKVLEQIASNIAAKNHPPAHEIKRFYPDEPGLIPEKKVEQELSVSQPLFNIGFKDINITASNPCRAEELLRRELVTEILLNLIFSSSESFFNELYEEGLIDDHFGYGYTGEVTHGYTQAGGRTKDPQALYQKVMEKIHLLKKSSFDRDSFLRQKRKALGQYIKGFNNLEFIANNYLSYRFKGASLLSFPRILESITLEEVEQRLMEHLQEDNHAVSIINPQEKGKG